ncbi:MAG: twin-arginine translocation signal domain-containing protein, partial [Zetaproteobacteria bacterium]
MTGGPDRRIAGRAVSSKALDTLWQRGIAFFLSGFTDPRHRPLPASGSPKSPWRGARDRLRISAKRSTSHLLPPSARKVAGNLVRKGGEWTRSPQAGSTNDGEASSDFTRRFWMDKKNTRKLSRRDFLKVGAAGVGVAALGSMPNQVFGAAPAVIKGTKLTILQGTYFIAPG